MNAKAQLAERTKPTTEQLAIITNQAVQQIAETIKPKTTLLQDEQQKQLKGETEEKPEEENDEAVEKEDNNVPSPRASRDDKNNSIRPNQATTTPEYVPSNNEEPKDGI